MKRVLIDNNIWAAHEMGYPDAVSYISQAIENDYSLIINTVIQMELLSHFEIELDPIIKEGRDAYIYQMADEIIQVDEAIAIKAGEIRRIAKISNKKVPKGPDALIAATAAIHNLTVISNSDKDFSWASDNFGFDYYNPITNNDNYLEYQEDYKIHRGLK